MAKQTPLRNSSSLNASAFSKTMETEIRRLWRAGLLQEAEQEARRLLSVDKKSPAALFILGNITRDMGKTDEAITWFRKCIKVAPHHYGAHANLGGILLGQGMLAEALKCLVTACKLAPKDANLHYNLGQCYRAMGRYDDAIQSYQQAIALNPDFVVAASDLGILLAQVGTVDKAEAWCRDWSLRYPQSAEPHISLGTIYQAQGRLAEARQSYEKALRLAPQHRQVLLYLAALYLESNDFRRAATLIQESFRLTGPKSAPLILLAELHARQGDNHKAIELMNEALSSRLGRPEDYLKLAIWYATVNQRGKAIEILETGIKLSGDQAPQLSIYLFYNQLCLGDWRNFHQQLAKVLRILSAPTPPQLEPFIVLQIPHLNSEIIYRVTRGYARQFDNWQKRGTPPEKIQLGNDGRIRIGYLSADFHEHATAYLTASVFEEHDKSKISLFAYSYGPHDQSATRQRLITSFDAFRNVQSLSHLEVAEKIRKDQINILVDLKGYTRFARPEILALRPAPIQVNWLGYPGTMGADFIDYIVVDPTVVPYEEATSYQESLAYLPHAYAPIDTKRKIAKLPSRAEAGLPENAFVYCCFNNPRKIIPEFFYIWCDLLKSIPNSVLWLFARNEQIIDNLQREAKRQGVNPQRILFAPRVSQSEHLARLALADLVLDTLPYNAHTTTADALLMGVPVLTCIGNTFAGRVAASLLKAADMPDLVTSDLNEYRTKAIELASNPNSYKSLRNRLKEAKSYASYFDMPGFARYLEDLYFQMYGRYVDGHPPTILSVAANPC